MFTHPKNRIIVANIYNIGSVLSANLHSFLFKVHEHCIFFREFCIRAKEIGTIWPTSARAAQTLCNVINYQDKTPLRILEVGAGTGSVTLQILKKMKIRDSLVICEINKNFMSKLSARLKAESIYQVRQTQVTLCNCSIQQLDDLGKFDVIICGLPLLNFDYPTLENILRKITSLSHPDTFIGYYEYIGFRYFSRALARAFNSDKFTQIDALFKEAVEQHKLISHKILWHVLPIEINFSKCNLPEAATLNQNQKVYTQPNAGTI